MENEKIDTVPMNSLPSLFSDADLLQLYEMELVSPRFSEELRNGCIYLVSNKDDSNGEVLLVSAKEKKTNVTSDDMRLISNAVILLHLDEWLFENNPRPNSRHIRLISTDGQHVRFQAKESLNESFAIDIEGCSVFHCLWGAFLFCSGSDNISKHAYAVYNERATKWRKNQI